MITLVLALVWFWCFAAVMACCIAGHLKDHPANKEKDKDGKDQ